MVCACFLAQSLLPQTVEVGIKGGFRPTEDITGSALSESKRYSVGPTVTVHLPRKLRVEFDVLYRRVGYSYASGSFASYGWSGTRAHSWEFPILVGRQIKARYYVAGGYAFRVLTGGVTNAVGVNTPPIGPQNYYSLSYKPEFSRSGGFVVSGGNERSLGRWTFNPEVRYTHWSKPFVNVAGSHGFRYQGTASQVDFLLGISFH